MKGKGIRMKLGNAHTIPMRDDQIKKIARNHSKGMASTISLDPYAIQELHGSGFFDSLKKIASNPIVKSISRVARPIATNMARGALSSMGPMGQALGNATIDVLDAEAQKRGYGVRKAGRPRKYVHHDVRMIEPALMKKRGKGFFDNLKKIASSDVTKSLSKSLRPMATDYLRSKLPQDGIMGSLSNLALNEANRFAESKGYGVKKRRGRPSKKGGALIAAGY